MIKADDIEVALLSMADDRHAMQLMRFFKTGPGEYGEGDKFIGLRNPQVQMVVKEAWRDTSLAEAVKLVKSPLHEVRLCGLLIMEEQYLRAVKKKNGFYIVTDEIMSHLPTLPKVGLMMMVKSWISTIN